MAFDRQLSLPSPTGAALNLYVRKAPQPPVAIVQINHGLAEHAARYSRFADFLAGHGFHVYAHDHRGHGLTKAPDAPLGRFAAANGAEAVLADVDAVHELIARDNAGVPVVVFGHSMGGLIALNVLIRRGASIKAGAIWNSNFGDGLANRAARMVLAWERFRLGSDVPSRLLPRLTFQAWAKKIPQRRTDFDWLSRDPVEVDAYVADPLCGWDASVSMWQDIFALMNAGLDGDRLKRIPGNMPLNLLGGGEDPATEGGKSVERLAKRLRRASVSNLTSRIYPQTRHESLNELNRNMIMEDFVAWARAAAAS